MCDYNGDGDVKIKFKSGEANLTNTTVGVWSCGPDGKDDSDQTRKDDLASWK